MQQYRVLFSNFYRSERRHDAAFLKDSDKLTSWVHSRQNFK